MDVAPLRVWSDGPESVMMPGSIVCGYSDEIALPARNDAVPAPLIETADADGPMELRTDDESQGEQEVEDEVNFSDTDDEWLDLFEGIDLSSYGE